MGKKSKFLKSIFKIGTIAPIVSFSTIGVTAISSCSPNHVTEHHIDFVSSTREYFSTSGQTTNLVFKFTGPVIPEKILTFEINENDKMSVINSENIPIDENGEFLITLSEAKNISQREIWKPQFIATYQIDEEERFELITPDLTFTYDYQSITITNIEPKTNIDIGTPVIYSFAVDAYDCIKKIDSVEIYGEAAQKLELIDKEDIIINDDHTFQIKLMPKQSIPGEADDLPLGFKLNYVSADAPLFARIDTNYDFFYCDLSGKKDDRFAFAVYKQKIEKTMVITLPKPYNPKTIKHIEIVFDEPVETPPIELETKENIPVEADHSFKIEMMNILPDTEQGLVVVNFHFSLIMEMENSNEDITYDSKTFSSNIMYNTPYDAHTVRIHAIDDGNVSFVISREDSPIIPSDYRLFYTVNGGTELKHYTLEESIPMKSGDYIDISNFCDVQKQQWSLSSTNFIRCSTTMPITVQGDVTSLLYSDPNNPQTVSLLGHESCFYCLFTLCNVLRVSDNFLATPYLSAHCYQGMFYQSELIQAPSLSIAGVLPECCYLEMFKNCFKMMFPPKEINGAGGANSIRGQAMQGMFDSCVMIEETPIMIFADICISHQWSLACCSRMFYACINLKAIYLSNFKGTKFSMDEFDEWTNGVAQKGTLYYNGPTNIPRTPYTIPRDWDIKPYPPTK